MRTFGNIIAVILAAIGVFCFLKPYLEEAAFLLFVPSGSSVTFPYDDRTIHEIFTLHLIAGIHFIVIAILCLWSNTQRGGLFNGLRVLAFVCSLLFSVGLFITLGLFNRALNRDVRHISAGDLPVSACALMVLLASGFTLMLVKRRWKRANPSSSTGEGNSVI